ncbi:hypothetical protein Tco_0945171, partial [Tanacetum coccineum]
SANTREVAKLWRIKWNIDAGESKGCLDDGIKEDRTVLNGSYRDGWASNNWNDHFFWVDEFVVPANARFGWFSGTNIVKDRAPTISEYNVEHANTLIAQASPFLRFPEEFLCWVGISRNYLLNKDTYPRFEYENGEEMDLNAFIRTADPRKVRIVERARAENERPIVTVAKHRTVTLLPTSVVRPSRELSASIEREFVGDAGGSGGGDQEIASVGGHDNVEPIVPTTDNVVAETEAPGPRRSKKKRVTRGSESIPAASHPPKRLRADYGTTGGSAAGGKSPSVLNRLLQDSLLTVEQGVPALPTLPFITSSVTASPLEEGGDHTDSVTGPSLRTVGPSARFVVLSDSSHHSGAKSADPEIIKGGFKLRYLFFCTKNTKQKNSKTSETISGSASGDFNLNNEADEFEEETQEHRPMGHDRSKAKKKSSTSSRKGSSSLVDLVADKFLNNKSTKWGKMQEQQDSYIQLKNQESFPSDMSLGNLLPPWHQFLDQKIRGAHFSLGIVAGERFAIELIPSTFPQRHFAEDRFPQRHVAGERVGMLLGKASNVVVIKVPHLH